MCMIIRRVILLSLLLGSCAGRLFAQLPKGITISGYADAYLAYYTDSLPAGAFQKFPTYAPRSGSIGLNIAQLSVAYKAETIRATITLHYGDIAKTTWSPTYNMVQEANAGIRLRKGLWLDAGFFRTHIGAEGIYPKENIASSLAILSNNEPYYEAGFKLTWQATPKLEARLYLLNGYNLFEDNNRKKSLGGLLTYTFSDACNVVYANYYGDDSPDSVHTAHNRFFNNFCFNYDHKKLRITAGFDVAVQQHSALGSTGAGFMSGGLLAARYTVYKAVNVYLRTEYFHDADGFLAGMYQDASGHATGLKAMGGTAGVEYKPTDNSYIRLEGRTLKTEDNIKPFYWHGAFTDRRYDTIFSVGVWF